MFKLPEKDHNFIEMEKKWLDTWYTKGLVAKYLHKNDSAKENFSFLDGPITANNPMGVHHAWGRTYKDLWQKFHNLLGHKQRFQNGFDCQGLWVEVEVEKDLKLQSKKDIENLIPGKKKESIAKFVDLCRQRVFKYSAIQTEQSKRLGYLMDWDHSYFTMSDENNYMIWLFLKTCFDNGWIYKGHDSVPWCPRCETAISQHEMLTEDYKEVVHESIYFELPIKGRKNEYLLVWTTTPWTLPANIAVAVDRDLEYSLVEGETGDMFWIAKDLVEKVFGKEYTRIVKTVKGEEIVGLAYEGPFDDLPAVAEVAKENPKNFHTVVSTDKNILPISTEEGTGLVHTAVSAGTEDFKLGKKLGLPMIPVIADDASYIEGLGIFTGKNAKKNPRLILDYLVEKDKAGENWVFKIHNYKHRYPACWRCKTELVWKVADEWYIAMDKPASLKLKVKSKKLNTNKTLRERMVETAKKIQWMPEFGLDRELDWLKNMHDWLISKKNRFWGLALPIYECTKCGHFEVIGSKEELQKRAVKGWKEFEGHSPHKPYIDEVVIKCAECGTEVHRVDDVGNPWLDAGIVSFSTITEHNQGEPLYTKNKKEWEKWFPVDFITESFPGQFKNWFYALIAMSTVLENTNPFKTVLGFGTMLDENSKPFHKSAGNAIEFVEGANKFGADIIRWICTSHNPADNILFGEHKVNDARRRFYLILWNTYKYFIEYANQDSWSVKSYELGVKGKNILDAWISNRFIQLAKIAKDSLLRYDAKDATLEIESFVSDLSTWYIRRSRDRVGVNSENTEDKESFYETLYAVLTQLSIVLSPFMPFISEQMYTTLTSKESVHLTEWPSSTNQVDKKLIHDMKIVREIAEAGHRVRKENKLKVRQPLANVNISLPAGKKLLHTEFIDDYSTMLASELNVKKIKFTSTKKDLLEVAYDTTLTPELKLEGEMRDLVREIQTHRKEKGLTVQDTITLTIPNKFSSFKDFIQKKVGAKKIVLGERLDIVCS